MLIKSKIKKNLYYEIKEQVKEERYDGVKTIYRKQKVKSYGSDNTKENRTKLIELLHQRVNYHKDKFIAPILYDELTTMEVKKNGRTEHAANAHDDQVFSYLWALYVWYYGENLMERFHIFKNELKTDQDLDETQFGLDERYGGLEEIESNYIDEDTDYDAANIVNEQNKIIENTKTVSMEEFYVEQARKDQEALDKILSTRYGREAVAKAYHADINYLNEQYGQNMAMDLSNDILQAFYDDGDKRKDQYDGNMAELFKKL